MPHVFVALAATLLGSAVSAVSPPKEKSEPLYFPTKVGTVWVYESEFEPDDTDTLRITAVAEKGGAKVVTVTEKWERKNPDTGKREVRVEATRTVTVSGEGVFQTADGEQKYDPPDPLLKLPHAAGAAWEWRDKAGEHTTRYKALAPQDVKVPAGTFKAIPVESVATQKGLNIGFEQTRWYAPGVGVVKRKWSVNFSGNDTYVLKSFTPGKD